MLDTEKRQILTAVEAFNFDYVQNQQLISRSERAIWIIQLFRCLNQFEAEYDLLHFHILWWGGLLMALWARIKKIPTIYGQSGDD